MPVVRPTPVTTATRPSMDQPGGAISRVTDSPTKLGFGAPSTVIVNLVTACHQPPSSSSKEAISVVPTALVSTGTGDGKRTLFQPELTPSANPSAHISSLRKLSASERV